MVLVCGDVHGTFDIHKLFGLRAECECGQRHLTKEDYVIVCGDFGLLWNSPFTREYFDEENWALPSNLKDENWSYDELQTYHWYQECPWTTLFVDGNHENYDRLETYPITHWHGGRVQKIGESIIHLMRGEIYQIDGHTYFCMGGAQSTDRGTVTGTEEEDIHKCWWPQEIPSAEEWDRAFRNLETYHNKVDFIITHDVPAEITRQTWKSYRISEVSNRLEMIRSTVDFTHWFCGHMHEDRRYGKVSILYDRIVNVEDFLNEYYSD